MAMRRLMLIGGIGLMGATFVDSMAVAGRHLGLGLLGSIELVQVSVILLGAAAMVIATMTHNHASVHIFTERMRPTDARDMETHCRVYQRAGLPHRRGGINVGVVRHMGGASRRPSCCTSRLKWLRLVWVLCALAIAGLVPAPIHRAPLVKRVRCIMAPEFIGLLGIIALLLCAIGGGSHWRRT